MKNGYLEKLAEPVVIDGEFNEEQSEFLLKFCGRGEIYRSLVSQYGKEAVTEALGSFLAPQLVQLQLGVLCPESIGISYNGYKYE